MVEIGAWGLTRLFCATSQGLLWSGEPGDWGGMLWKEVRYEGMPGEVQQPWDRVGQVRVVLRDCTGGRESYD